MRRPDRLRRPESRVREADEPTVALRDDQAGRLEMRLGGDLQVEVGAAQWASRPQLGSAPIPERSQGGRIVVAERAKVDHRFGFRGAGPAAWTESHSSASEDDGSSSGD